MEFTKENMQFYIFMGCKLGESVKLIDETLQTICGDCACSCRWVKEFNEECFFQVKSAINEQRPKFRTSRTLLLHDNAGPHKARATTQSLRVLSHQAYSLDVTQCDFWLFPILKDRLAGRKFDRIQDLTKAVNSELQTIPEKDYQGVFRKIRLKRCIESHGEYFDGL
ncbi:transposase [Elysia marginata]|uniref:Transposase n=1 Tax=Elysia marginata TaxID=1093978 RepID=A0AAV4G0W7_9GAST|nr:transposase [Elysia marginata]